MTTLLFIASLLAGAIASMAGFGIGSVLTPLLAISVGTKEAVVAVSIPHFVATAIRFWALRGNIDKHVLKHFGISSAAGGLVGALLGSRFSSPVLAYILGGLLVFAGVTGLTGIAQKMRFGRRGAWLGGAVSGVLGGLVGNQGGIRSAALLGFNLAPKTFVATATAIALVVDGARMPVYFFTSPETVHRLALWITVMVVGGAIGTLAGARILARIPEIYFRRLVSLLILALGVVMLSGLAK
ncbi:MAG TPA: sulfite exporter TauE/SafE family protein [Candidatus Sulfotelmatobacter sp.]|nr:sulfite exporter TauE/SafE family protein [Candidatus Sulfotelmatobacter sp.]